MLKIYFQAKAINHIHCNTLHYLVIFPCKKKKNINGFFYLHSMAVLNVTFSFISIALPTVTTVAPKLFNVSLIIIKYCSSILELKW